MKVLRGSIVAAVMVAIAACHGTAATYSVSGSVTGSTGPFVVKLNGANDISMSGDGSFKFTGKLLQDDTFNVQIVDVNDRCTVTGGAGTVGMTDITGVSIACVANAPAQSAIRSAILNGAQENPPVTTSASGTGGIIILNMVSPTITGGITFSGLTPLSTQIHIHQAPSGNPTGVGPGIIALTLAADGLTAVIPPGTALTAGQVLSLLAGELYFNVGTTANPSGEIRGPIQLQGGVAANVAGLDKTQVAPQPTTSTAVGVGTLLADLATGKILIAYITHNVTNATAAAIHTSTGPTANGASVVLFTNLQTNFDPPAGDNLASPIASPRLTAQNLADFASSLLYFEVDSQANPNGEIRGNISPL